MRVFSEIDVVVQFENGDVVCEGTGIEFRMHENADDVAFDVRVEFDVVVHIPFA